MRDRGLIAVGLLVFLAVVTVPVWYGAAARTSTRGPELKLPVAERQCVEPTPFMRDSHMDLLISWREQVVRQNIRTYVATDGRRYDMSLSKTCLKCHANKAEFCDRCHTYASVSPPCFDCHVDPSTVAGGTTRLARRIEP
jgi:hypothetical protein